MNKTPYLVAAIVALMATAPTAYAEDHIYGKLGANLSTIISIDALPYNVPINNISAGYSAESGVMPEFALGYDLGKEYTCPTLAATAPLSQ